MTKAGSWLHPCPALQKEADGIFRRMLGIEEKETPAAARLARQPRWRKVEGLIKSYLGNTLHLLGEACSSGGACLGGFQAVNGGAALRGTNLR